MSSITILGKLQAKTKSQWNQDGGALLGSAMSYYLFRPSCVIAYFPFHYVDRIEVSASHDIQKERSIGQIFFAHQKGAHLVMTVHGYLLGPNKGVYLSFLELLHLYSKKEVTDYAKENLINKPKGIDVPVDPKTGANLAGADLSNSLGGNGKGIRYASAGDVDINNNNAVTWTTKGGLNPLQAFVKHKTFPILTEDGFYTRMYLQTFTYNRDVHKHGLDAIEFTAIFERYASPPPIQPLYDKKKVPDKNDIKKAQISILQALGGVINPVLITTLRNALRATQAFESGADEFRGIGGTKLDTATHLPQPLQGKTAEIKLDPTTEKGLAVWTPGPGDKSPAVAMMQEGYITSTDSGDMIMNALWRGSSYVINHLTTQKSGTAEWLMGREYYTDPIMNTIIRSNPNNGLPTRGSIMRLWGLSNLQSVAANAPINYNVPTGTMA